MTRRSPLSAPRVLVSITLLALGALAAGCGSSVGGGGGEGGSGGGGGNDQGCDEAGVFRPCSMPGDPAGQPSGGQECIDDGDGNLVWKACEAASTAASTPLVLSFDGAPVALTASLGAFDVDGTMSVVTDWPAAATPWLALDRDGNGSIDDGSELFGSATILGSGARASNGFVALAELDSNGDGRITPEDAAWSSLRIWSDADGDRASRAAELASLDARRVLSIDLAYTSSRRCDARQNCEIERAAFRWADASGAPHTGAVVDVHLKHQ